MIELSWYVIHERGDVQHGTKRNAGL